MATLKHLRSAHISPSYHIFTYSVTSLSCSPGTPTPIPHRPWMTVSIGENRFGRAPTNEQVVQIHKVSRDQDQGENPCYQLGDRVWLATKEFRQPQTCKKINHRYIGPYKVIKQINLITCKLDHVSHLKPVIPGPLASHLKIQHWGPACLSGKTIHNSCWRNSHLEYLVKWEGYGSMVQC